PLRRRPAQRDPDPAAVPHRHRQQPPATLRRRGAHRPRAQAGRRAGRRLAGGDEHARGGRRALAADPGVRPRGWAGPAGGDVDDPLLRERPGPERRGLRRGPSLLRGLPPGRLPGRLPPLAPGHRHPGRGDGAAGPLPGRRLHPADPPLRELGSGRPDAPGGGDGHPGPPRPRQPCHGQTGMSRSGLRFVVALVLGASILGAAPPPARGAATPACELLTLAEVGRVAGGTMEIDPSASGEDDRGGDNCVWRVKGTRDPVVAFRIERLAAAPKADGAFKAAEVEAFGGGPRPAAVPGLGDAALYRDFQKVKGGALLVRRGTTVFSFSGSV